MSARMAIGESRFTRALDRRVRDLIRRRDVFRPRETVVVGISGGADSTALLLILSRLRRDLGLRVTAAHFDHRLRSPEEAEGDRDFVERLCRALRLPLVVGSGNVPGRARRERESIEEAARVLRYRFFGREAKRPMATALVVGHTRNDRAETVLLHIIRGSGLDGLAAMPPRAPWPFGRGPDIARPLLEVSRSETERYCLESGVEPRRDPTNDLLIATRNRVRHELMPVLRSLNPRIDEALSRLAEAAGRDLGLIESLAAPAWRRAASRDGGAVVIDREYLEGLDPAIASRLVRRAASEASAGAADLTWEDVERVLGTLRKRRARTTLPGGLVAITHPRNLTIWPGGPPRPQPIPELALKIPGSVRAGPWTIEARTGAPAKSVRPAGPREALLDAEAVRGQLAVRSRRPGDRLRPLGLGGTKKVQDILVDAKAPAEERDAVPIICDEKGIVWVAGHCIDERVKVGPKTKHVLRLDARRR